MMKRYIAVYCVLNYKACLATLFITLLSYAQEEKRESNQLDKTVTIAILAKDKAHTLPLYLECIEAQTWPKNRTNLYVRTNNNKDSTSTVLKEWLNRVKDQYHEIYFDDTDVPEQVQQYGQHEWNSERFTVLGRIRQESVQWAHEHNSHYFVADCDNFIFPHTLETLLKTGSPIVAPLLKSSTLYSNYHADVDENGYYKESPLYLPLLKQEVKVLIPLPVVHCTYLIRHEVLDKMSYDDKSGRYEYVIFSDNARKHGIPQYLDAREVYGYLTFAENKETLQSESWFYEFIPPSPVPPQGVTVAILAKDKAHTLPLYLACIESQTWPKNKTYLYIRTNNNNDTTAALLRTWVERVKDQYAEVYFDDSDVPEQVQRYGQYEWNNERFKVLSRLRQESIQWAYEHNTHYFMADCDNFIIPATLETLVKTNLPLVAPLLKTRNAFANYHADIDQNGYYKDSPLYWKLLSQEIKNLVKVPVVHSSYFIRRDILPKISYDDGSYRYDYVIFSSIARQWNIPQYLDTRSVYGYMSFTTTLAELEQEPWFKGFTEETVKPLDLTLPQEPS